MSFKMGILFSPQPTAGNTWYEDTTQLSCMHLVAHSVCNSLFYCDKSVNKERGTGTGNEEPERGTGTGNEALERGTRNPTTLSK